MGNRPVKLENGIYRQQLSRASRRRSTQPPRVLNEKQLNEVNKYLNSHVRLHKRLRGLDETQDVLDILGYGKTVPKDR